MKTYKQLFEQNKKTVMVPFFVIGDPDFDTSLDIVKTAIDAGADILELGIPFSDPIADGPTIQKADIRSLNAGMTVKKALAFIEQIKKYADIPIGLLMYYNLIYQYGIENFFTDFHNAGTNSVLVADLNIDDADEIMPAVNNANMESVFMVTPNTTDQRIEKIIELTTGFIYTVSLLGVTGSRDELSDMINPLIKKLKDATTTPICVGFGISKPKHAKQLADAGANGVIIGSRLVRIIEENLNDKKTMLNEIQDLIKSMKLAIE